MKDVKMLVWLSQLGLSALMPPAVCILLAVWLKKQFSLGDWVVIVCVVAGVYAGIKGFLAILKTADQLQNDKKDPPPVSFNEHQ